MTVVVYVEKDTGSYETPSLPVYVVEDAGGALSLSAARAAVDAQVGVTIPLLYDGLPNDGNPSQQRLSKSAWRFVIHYRQPGQRPSRPNNVGEVRFGFQWRCPRRWVQFAPEVARYPSFSRPSHGIVAQVWDAHMAPVSSGVWLDPPAPNLSASVSVAPGTVSGSWARGIASLCGAVNSSSLTGGAYAAGEILLTHVVGSLISADAFLLDFGWNWTPNVVDETRDGVEDVSYNGQDFVWDGLAPAFGPEVDPPIAWAVVSSYVHQVRPYADLSALGIQPP
ncbi:MAG TPA: hypothetical protein PKC18_04090 [Lacipirellulaceae bacterium]|nr:hypothetical protein [Lacipirellulaceae bacterium]